MYGTYVEIVNDFLVASLIYLVTNNSLRASHFDHCDKSACGLTNELYRREILLYYVAN